MIKAPRGLVLDSQGVSEAARGAKVIVTLIGEALADGAPVVVSAVTLAEVLRGHARDAAVHRLLGQVKVQPVTDKIGRQAGELLGLTKRNDTIDAVVVATAASMPSPVVIVTSDPDDIGALMEGVHGVRVEVV